MKLIFTESGTTYDCAAQQDGKIEIYQKDPTLQSVLKLIDTGGIAQLGDMGVFGAGLEENFESEQLTSKGKITPKGKEIADSGYNWKGLYGRFVFKVLDLGGKRYLLNCEEIDKQNLNGFEYLEADLDLEGVYRPRNNKGFRNIRLDKYIGFGNKKNVNVELSYDFKEKTTTYTLSNQDVEFQDTDEFRHIDFDGACDKLAQICENYGLATDENEVILHKYRKNDVNKLLEATINELFSNHKSVNLEWGKCRAEEVRFIVNNIDVVKELLYDFLSRAACKSYLSHSKVSSLIEIFYKFFERCKSINESTEEVYKELLERTKTEDKKAHLRLYAYEDMGGA
jgi:hypothetical protein